MKILKRLTMITLAFAMFMSSIVTNAEADVKTLTIFDDTSIKSHAEELYRKINNFLIENKDIPPEKFDDVCKKYMSKNIAPINLLDQKTFDEKAKNSIVLYHGLSHKHLADDLKKGIVYVPSNTQNVRGIGMYTTTSLECAKRYSYKSNPDTIVKMLMPKDIKVLENEYLEKLKGIIRSIHKEEFGDFSDENKETYIFDSMSEYINEQLKEAFELIERSQLEGPDEQQRLLDEMSKRLSKDPICQKLKANRTRYFKTNRASVFYNSGLLTKLLGFDVLHSVDYLSDTVYYKEEEYLVVNCGILSILNNCPPA